MLERPMSHQELILLTEMMHRADFDPADPYAGSDHVIGGVWGHHVSFMQPTHVIGDPVFCQIVIWGHLPAEYPIHVGHHIVHSYMKHWVRFRVTEVELKADPPDMFFATMVPTEIYNLEGKLVWRRGLVARARLLLSRVLTTFRPNQGPQS